MKIIELKNNKTLLKEYVKLTSSRDKIIIITYVYNGIIIAQEFSFKVKTSGIKSLIKVPTGTLILQGFSTAPPEIVNALSIKGFPSRKASEIAHTVPTLQIITPASAGSFPLGISIPRQEATINFSEP